TIRSPFGVMMGQRWGIDRSTQEGVPPMRDIITKLRAILTRRDKRGAILLLCMMLFGAGMEMIGVGAIPAFVALLSDPARFGRYPAARFLTSHLPSSSTSALILTSAGVLFLVFVVKNLYLGVVVITQARYTTRRQILIA